MCCTDNNSGDKISSSSKEEFLSSIVHELRTPLSAVIAFSEILEEDIQNPDRILQCTDYIKEIKDLAKELDEMIHDILDVGTSSSGLFSIDLSQTINIHDTINRAIKLNYDYALKRKITIEFDQSVTIPAINLDEKRTKQILINIISNAIKYSTTDSTINIITQATDKFLQIEIQDEGFGMTEKEIACAIKKHHMIDNPNRKIVDSFGLGLPIVKQLVESQNGTMTITSNPGKGTKVCIKFPY